MCLMISLRVMRDLIINQLIIRCNVRIGAVNLRTIFWFTYLQYLHSGYSIDRQNKFASCNKTYLSGVGGQQRSNSQLQANCGFEWQSLLDTVYRYSHEKDRFVIWDLGGKQNIRKIWQNYYSECHGVIYMLNENISEGLEVLKTVATHQEMARIPILIIVLRQSDKECVQLLLKGSDYMASHSYMVHSLSIDKFILMRTSIKDMLHWLYFQVKQLHQSIRE